MLLQSCFDDFADRWAAILRPLRGLEGAAFITACEDIRGASLAPTLPRPDSK
jgi:hypothetical protein